MRHQPAVPHPGLFNAAADCALHAVMRPDRCLLHYKVGFHSLADVYNIQYSEALLVNNYVWNVFLLLINQKTTKKRH